MTVVVSYAPAEVYARLRKHGEETLPASMTYAEQTSIASGVRRLAKVDGLAVAQMRGRRYGTYRHRNRTMSLGLVTVTDRSTLVRPDAT